MVEPREATWTACLRDACRATHADTFGHAAQAVAQRRWRRTLEPIRLLRERAEMLPDAVVRDASSAGLDWWQIADYLNMHPQHACKLHQMQSKERRLPRSNVPTSPCGHVPAPTSYTSSTPRTEPTSTTQRSRTACTTTRPYCGCAKRMRW